MKPTARSETIVILVSSFAIFSAQNRERKTISTLLLNFVFRSKNQRWQVWFPFGIAYTAHVDSRLCTSNSSDTKNSCFVWFWKMYDTLTRSSGVMMHFFGEAHWAFLIGNLLYNNFCLRKIFVKLIFYELRPKSVKLLILHPPWDETSTWFWEIRTGISRRGFYTSLKRERFR